MSDDGATVLVVDGGGRGHAMGKALTRSNRVGDVLITPPNAGVHEYRATRLALESEGKHARITELIEKADDHDVDLVVPGPEGWLSAGIVDRFQAESDVPILGPTQEAAVLETSKCDTKDYLSSIGVPVPEYENFEEVERAKEWARTFYDDNPQRDLVPKADGIAAGKGAFVCSSLDETLTAIDRITSEAFNTTFDNAGRRLEIEERLHGTEISFFAISDGETVRPFATARDYKRRFADSSHPLIERYFDGINPNTGGMGAFSPVPLSDGLHDRIMETIVRPTVDEFEHTYRGILHFVLMIVEERDELQPYVLEINVRDGDPEAQARLPRLETDMFDVYASAARETLDDVQLEWSDESTVAACVVSGPQYSDGERVSGGYPGEYHSKQPVFLRGKPDDRIGAEGVESYVEGHVFHNATDLKNGEIRSRGGRVLTFANTDPSIEAAREAVYEDVEEIFFNSMQYRDDIAESVYPPEGPCLDD